MQLEHYLPFRLTRLSARVTEAVSQIHAKRFGLSRDEWRLLTSLGDHEARPTRDVTEATGLDKVATSRAASALEERGLIARSEGRGDRRVKIMRLTAKGAETLAELDRVLRAREAYLLEGLSDEQRACLDGLITRLDARAEALVAPETAQRCRPDCAGACERAERMFGLPEAALAPHQALGARSPAGRA